MVDCATYLKMVPTANQSVPMPFATLHMTDVSPEEIHWCAPTVFGFAFSVKRWGRFNVENFTKIQWNTHAFDHLVLSETKKTLIQSVVFADRSDLVEDVVPNKAGGFLVVLHGKPGTGKTLTAEAAAEKAHRPLVVLSSLGLGIETEHIEQNLRTVLELCKTWNAMLLIDEAEVLLEARSLGDIQRNAMVSVLLRLFEYHQEVIFLTTNHIGRIDAAFKSRIAIALRYPDLDEHARQLIWVRFLNLASVQIIEGNDVSRRPNSITTYEIRKLSERNLNGRCNQLLNLLTGRQIKNAMRTAQAVARFKNCPLNYELLDDVIESTADFGDFVGACECQTRKLESYNGRGGNDRAIYLRSLVGTLPVEMNGKLGGL